MLQKQKVTASERSDAERSMHFFDSAVLFFVNFTSVSSTDLGQKSFHAIALAAEAEAQINGRLFGTTKVVP